MKIKKQLNISCPKCGEDLSECFITSVAAQIWRRKSKGRTLSPEDARAMQEKSAESRRKNKE